MDIQGKRVKEFGELKNPGDFLWHEEAGTLHAHYLMFICPCGCTRYRGVPAHRSNEVPQHKPSWLFTGELDQPTLAPSIKVIGECGWHGFLIGGVFKSC